MLNIPAPRIRPHQHILPPRAKYVVVWAIILLAVASSYLPTPATLHARSHYRDKVTIEKPKRVKPVNLSNSRVKRNKSVAIKKERSTRIINDSSQPMITPTPMSKIKQATTTPRKEERSTSSTPTPTPTVRTPVAATGNTEQDLLSALNAYRQKNGNPALSWDGTLAAFAKERSNKFDADGKMDGHQGFREMLANDGFSRMGFNALAENSSYGDTRDPVYIIETLYGQSAGHNENQLSNEYTHVGIGASGKATNFIFGGRKK